MDIGLFEKCIKYIVNNYEVVQLEDLIGADDYYKDKKIATLDFDDGYKDNIEYAAPILAKYNCKASFNVVTDCVEKNVLPWTQILNECFQFTNIPNLNIDFDFIPEGLKVKQLPTREDRLQYFKKISKYLMHTSHELRNIVMMRIVLTYQDVEFSKVMMNWDDIRQLKNAGHNIGSHTTSHCMLGTMTDEDEVRKELSRSGNAIKDNLGFFPKIISYPINSYNETTIRISKEVGYEAGLAVKQDVYEPGKDSIFEMPRIELYNESWLKTKLRISNRLEDIKSLIRYREMKNKLDLVLG